MAKIVFNLTLKDYVPKKEMEYELKEPMPLLAFLESQQIPAEQVGLVVRNGRWEAKSKCIVHPDDTIELFPYLQGG